ncbi:MAG: TonB family protein [Gemmatimonas sp.]|nr:TonB family protein [Gemmatimonas sp.]
MTATGGGSAPMMWENGMTRTTRAGTMRMGTASNGRRSWAALRNRSIVVAVAFHAGLLAFTPEAEVEYSDGARPGRAPLTGLITVRAPHATEPPAEVPRPALPTVAEIELDPASLLAAQELALIEDSPVISLPTPPIRTETDEWATFEKFAPSMVRPDISNRREVVRYLERFYTPILRRTGATGQVILDFWIDEKGMPRRAAIVTSSGREELDDLSMSLSKLIRFRPALRAGEPIRVQVRVPIHFRASMVESAGAW